MLTPARITSNACRAWRSPNIPALLIPRRRLQHQSREPSSQDPKISAESHVFENFFRDPQTPSLRLYDSLIRANADRETGSAARVGALLDELAEEGIDINNETFHGAIRVRNAFAYPASKAFD